MVVSLPNLRSFSVCIGVFASVEDYLLCMRVCLLSKDSIRCDIIIAINAEGRLMTTISSVSSNSSRMCHDDDDRCLINQTVCFFHFSAKFISILFIDEEVAST